jgi:broad specificity phosphatase PhoE
MTAYEINNKINAWLPHWETCENENESENIAYIQDRLNNGLLELFEAMRNDLGVMAEHGDDETSILYDLLISDDDIIQEYKEMYL